MAENLFFDKRYILHETLGQGGMGVVYRATDRLTGQIVALKRITMPPNRLMFAACEHKNGGSHAAMAQEFRSLALLRHPNIISVFDYGFEELCCPYFTMEYLDKAQTIIEAGKGQSIPERVNLLVQVLQALVYLHRQGILHRDLKPENILVQAGQVRLLDFGISTVIGQGRNNGEQTIAGTLAYMAPELLAGEPASTASDLYAVGVLAYELLAGQPLYDSRNIAVLMKEILGKPLKPLLAGLEGDIAVILERLLTRKKGYRYEDAHEVIKDLAGATHQPVPLETVEIQQGSLQSARFTGRETELAHLTTLMKMTLQGQGSVWLIGGKSGVGKSRLVDELRIQALVEQILVVRGWAVNERNSPYQVWRDVLPRLILQDNLSDEEASALKPLVPNINNLLGREILATPLLDPQASQARLLRTVSNIFQRQTQLVLVILEDLQWARPESLALLNHLKQIVPKLPVLIIGNYRDDERPDLPDILAGINVLKIK